LVMSLWVVTSWAINAKYCTACVRVSIAI
jgi:hypothetical protein